MSLKSSTEGVFSRKVPCTYVDASLSPQDIVDRFVELEREYNKVVKVNYKYQEKSPEQKKYTKDKKSRIRAEQAMYYREAGARGIIKFLVEEVGVSAQSLSRRFKEAPRVK